MNAEKFWLGWLKTVIIIFIVTCISFAFLSKTDSLGALHKLINYIFFANKIPVKSMLLLQDWLMPVICVALAGRGLAMIYLISIPLKNKELWAWKCIFYSVMIWFFIDSMVSVYLGVGFHVLINCILFLQLMAPLLFLKSYSIIVWHNPHYIYRAFLKYDKSKVG
jgi:hypothetical protein